MSAFSLAKMNEDTKSNWEEWYKYRRSLEEVYNVVTQRYQIGTKNLLLLGVGNGNDIPIDFIESTFENITIVDIDEVSLDRFLLKVGNKNKFTKKRIDLSGIQHQVSNGKELINKIDELVPEIDLSKLSDDYDLVVNCCFSTQLLTSFFYGESSFPKGIFPPEIGNKLTKLSDLIHLKLFDELHRKLNGDGILLHLSDTVELKANHLTGDCSPAILHIQRILNGDWKNIHKIIESLPQLREDGMCLLGSSLHEDIFKKYSLRTAFSLLWEFAHTNIEDRNYVVIGTVLAKVNLRLR